MYTCCIVFDMEWRVCLFLHSQTEGRWMMHATRCCFELICCLPSAIYLHSRIHIPHPFSRPLHLSFFPFLYCGQQSNDLLRHLPTAAFIAIDEEMTGISVPPGVQGQPSVRPPKDATPARCYDSHLKQQLHLSRHSLLR